VSEWILIEHAFAQTRDKFGWSREVAERELDAARITGQLGDMRGDRYEWPDGTIEYKNIKMRADALLHYWQSIEAKKR
jgi:hypothetical protein